MSGKFTRVSIGLVIALGLIFSPVVSSSKDGPAWENILFDEESPRISMDFKEANLKDVLKIFSQQAKLNFVANQALEDRRITLYLANVPVDEALRNLLLANNLTYVRDEGSDIFIIKDLGESEVETVTKVYYLKFARVPGSNLSREINKRVYEDGGTSSSSSIGSSSEQAQSNIVEAVRRVQSVYGRLDEDVRTNSLIVTDLASKFPAIEETIARLDIPIPQVMIEIEMLDTSKNALDELGVKVSSEILEFTGPSRETNFFFGKDLMAPNAVNDTYFGLLSARGFTATLEFLKTHTDTKYLARPRLLTLSNETSEIKIVADEAIGVTTETATVGSTGSVTQTAERAQTGIFLRVTPQINLSSDEITMFLETSVTEASAGSIVLQGNTVKNPETRGTKTTVMMGDGETIIVGGLIRTIDSQIKKKVPILGDIPFLGALFRHRQGDTKNRELLIFITPHIVTQSSKQARQTSAFLTNTAFEREQGPIGSVREEVDRALSVFERESNL